MEDYLVLLRDSRWIKKAKRIRKRDKHCCTACGSKKYLVVHHTFYYLDYPAPWKYPDDSLLTLCSKCHQRYHEQHEIELKDPPGKNRKKKMRENKKPYRQKIMSLAEFQVIRGLRIKERKTR